MSRRETQIDKQLSIKGKFNRYSRRKISKLGKAIICSAALLAFSTSALLANPLDWFGLSGKKDSGRKAQTKFVVQDSNMIQMNESDMGIPNAAIQGGNLDPYKFAQAHWSDSKKKLELMCRAFIGKSNDKGLKDITRKLFVLDTQLYKESIKNSAVAVNQISANNQKLKGYLSNISRVITSPSRETLDNLDRSINELAAANSEQSMQVKRALIGSENLISVSAKSYETLELIPSLSIPALDMFVQTSKQLMKQNQSNSEAFKGLLLNIQSSCEQLNSGLISVKTIVKNTLKFSDHFAIQQFPLVNLPTPTREKIYIQLNTLKNTLTGISNTLSIGDSQVRNASQQFTHLVQGLTAKASEALKFSQNESNGGNENNQISAYSLNQVSGLYQRVKEDIAAMRSEMAQVQNTGLSSSSPLVSIETRNEYASRKAQSASQEKLPLFLLGGKQNKSRSDESKNVVVAKARAPQTRTTVLYSETPENQEKIDQSGLMQSEMNILKEELGGNFFFNEKENGPEDVSMNSTEVAIIEEDPELQSDSIQISYDNLESDEPQIELMKFESVSSNESSESDLMPLMKLEDEQLFFND